MVLLIIDFLWKTPRKKFTWALEILFVFEKLKKLYISILVLKYFNSILAICNKVNRV